MVSSSLFAALAMVSAVAGLSTPVAPSVVRVLVTSTVTVLPTSSLAAPTLLARQWEAPSAPVWSEPAPAWSAPSVWSAPPVATWTQPAWVPSAAPPATPKSPPTKWPENKQLTKTNYILAAIVVGSIFGACVLFGIIGCILMKCHRRKNPAQSDDVELATQLRPGTNATNDTTATGGARSTLGSITQHAPQHLNAQAPVNTRKSRRQPVHCTDDHTPSPVESSGPTHITWVQTPGQSGRYYAS